MRAIAGVVTAFGLALTATAALASDMTPPSPRQDVALGFWGDQRGCYWRRGVRHCSRYCYWETDGRRYCQERERFAYPQGNPWFVPFPPEPPIYLRRPAARP